MEGGIEFTGKLHDCYFTNLYLRTANRVLMRITEFNVTNFRKLDKKIKEIPWELYLKENTAKCSRLYHSDAISEHIIESINERKKTVLFHSDNKVDIQPQKTQNIQNIFIRLIEDHIIVSLDSSGDLLYKRGIKQHTGSAPIRETIAAATLLKMGYTGEQPLLDPMCGTGTFSIEAAMVAMHIPPGWYRHFAFESWPGFKPAQWEYMKKQAEKGIKKNHNIPCIIACDKDTQTCRALSDTLKKNNLENVIKVLSHDFYTLTPDDIYLHAGNKNPGLVIINPPYGVRLGARHDSRNMFIEITERLADFFEGWKFALSLRSAG